MTLTKGLKPLRPSLRDSNRYIAFEIMSKKKISSFDTVRDTIETAFRNLHGDLLMAQAGLMVVKNTWNEGTQRGVIKVERRFSDHVRAALVLIAEIKGQNVLIHSLISSGMINRAKKHMAQGA